MAQPPNAPPRWEDDEVTQTVSTPPQANPEVSYSADAMLTCPACNHTLSQHKCKLVCPQCGYYMSCADYY